VGEKTPGGPFGYLGYLIDMPDFGGIFPGEVLVYPGSVPISMVQAELGRSTHGKVSGGAVSVRGGIDPPSSPYLSW
jgi:hypothetical protein